MQRIRAIVGLAALLGLGTATALGGPFMSQYWSKGTPDGVHWGPQYTPQVPTVQGAWGEPVEVAAPYNVKPPNGADAARAMLAQSMPLELVQQSGYFKDSSFPIMQTGGQCPGGVCPPGVAPPGNLISPPGVAAVPPGALPPGLRPPGAVAAVGALTGPVAAPFPVQRTEVRFVGPAGMKISWYGPSADGRGSFGPQYLQAPARYNFLQASIYRLKLSDIPNRPGVEYYPTLEVVPAKQKTCTFLAHSAVPVVFTEEDFEQVAAGNFVVKVIYLPDPQFQDLAATGPDEVVSSRLEPGVDPIIEAKRRGSILLVVRLGNIDLEAPNTPAMDAPNPFAPVPPVAPPGAAPKLPLPPVPGVPMAAGQPPMPNMPNQMAPNMSPAPPMVPYGMLNGQQLPPGAVPMQPNPAMMPQAGAMPMQPNPAMMPQGQMVPQMPNVPGSYPVGTQLPPAPGMPTSQAPTPGSVQGVQYQSLTQTTSRLPTVAELAGQPNNAKTSFGSK
ncbi:MAG TPA: hypothetical protein VE999_12725 [Gemmataceae bacterium]|nr:hypothetical protein [Gemmataceae bacterium]